MIEQPFASTIVALEGQATVIRGMLDHLGDTTAQTRLPDWSVSVLIGHLAAGSEATRRWLGDDPGGRTEVNSVSYWDLAASVAEQSSQWAITYAAAKTDRHLVEELDGALTLATQTAGTTDASHPVIPPLGAIWIRFDEFLVTRLLELTVHGLDLADAIGDRTLPHPGAAAIVAGILDSRVTGDRPTDLGGDVEWIEAATGRVPHPDHRLPVIA